MNIKILGAAFALLTFGPLGLFSAEALISSKSAGQIGAQTLGAGTR